MKHRFLLDVMVLYFAIKEEDSKRTHEETCANLIQLIGQNCHRVVVDRTMSEKYERHLSELFARPEYQMRVALFLADVIYRPEKFVVETSRPPEIPVAAANAIPKEDHYVVRAALISRPIIVTDEEKLRNRINAQSGVLGLRAVSPSEALELAKEA